MKTIYLIPIILLMTNSVSAEKTRSEKKENQKTVRLNYDECIQRYGVDDTSIAIINIYFDKRYTAGVGQMSFLPVTAALTIITPPIGATLMIVSSPLYVNGALKFNTYSQKNMVKTLNNYHNNSVLAEKMREKVVNYIFDEDEKNEKFEEDYKIELTNIRKAKGKYNILPSDLLMELSVMEENDTLIN